MPKIGRKLLVLRFEDPDWEGIEVKIRSTSMRAILELQEQTDAARKGGGLKEISDLIDRFCDKLESWNIEDDDGAIPPTRNGLLSLDFPDAVYLILSWVDAMTAIEPSLGKDSTSGEPSPEVQLPMEPLSTSPPS